MTKPIMIPGLARPIEEDSGFGDWDYLIKVKREMLERVIELLRREETRARAARRKVKRKEKEGEDEEKTGLKTD